MYIDRVIELPDSELAEETKHKYLILKVGINESEHIFKGASDDLKEADKIARQEKGMVYRRFMSGKYGEAISPFYKSYTIMKYTKTSTETVGNFKTLEEAIAANNLDSAFEAAHSLKGVLGNLALTPVYEPVFEITELLRAKSDVDYGPYLNKISEKKTELEKLLQ